jgi:hypothetical protein
MEMTIMSKVSPKDFFQALNFEETEIEDKLMALSCEFEDGSYGLITDEEGALPESVNQPIVFAYYTPEDSFLWSTSFKNSYIFKDIWSAEQTAEQNLAALLKYREDKAYY